MANVNKTSLGAVLGIFGLAGAIIAVSFIPSISSRKTALIKGESKEKELSEAAKHLRSYQEKTICGWCKTKAGELITETESLLEKSPRYEQIALAKQST